MPKKKEACKPALAKPLHLPSSVIPYTVGKGITKRVKYRLIDKSG
jgi:hypothetical protein